MSCLTDSRPGQCHLQTQKRGGAGDTPLWALGSVLTHHFVSIGCLVSPALSPAVAGVPMRTRTTACSAPGHACEHSPPSLFSGKKEIDLYLDTILPSTLGTCCLGCMGGWGCGGRFHGVFNFLPSPGRSPEGLCPRPGLLAPRISRAMSHTFQKKFVKREKQQFGETVFLQRFDVETSTAASTCFRPGPEASGGLAPLPRNVLGASLTRGQWRGSGPWVGRLLARRP